MRISTICLTALAALGIGAGSAHSEERSPFWSRKEDKAEAPSKKTEKPAKKKAELAKSAPFADAFAWLPLSESGLPKRVEINLTEQRLRAYEGSRVVLTTKISSGRNGATPTGRFRAGYKDAEHYSSLYHNAPMPWSVQVSGNIFIHGFTIVPDFPASHGCIRVPLTGRNPAKRFFNWVTPGTPIVISY